MVRFCFASLRVRLTVLMLLAVLPALGLTLHAYLKERQLQKAYVREQALLLKNLPDNVYIGVGIVKADPFGSADQTLVRNLIGLALVAICVIAIVWLASELFILQWVQKLTKVSRQLAAGDLKARIDGLIDAPRELSQLAQTFNEIAESLERQLTERQRIEACLKRANERFNFAAAAHNATIYDWDIEKNTVERTQGLVDVLGYRLEEAELSIEWWLERIHPDDQQRVSDQITTYLENTILDFAIEYRVRHQDGRYLYVWNTALIVRSADGRAEHVIGSIIDISDRKRAEEALRESEERYRCINETLEQRVLERTAELEAANQELDAFCYSVSHDLRAPLRHVRGFVDALSQQLERSGAFAEPKVAHYIEVIQDSSQKMTLLIDGLLTLSRLGRKQLANQPVNLRQLVDNAIALVNSQTQPGSLRHIEFTIRDLPTVMGDATLLQQVFSNLIDNAVKFSRDRHPAIITIGTLADDTIFVKDNGVGFQMEYADQLFAAFGRLHSQKDFIGTGIGLAIVQRIIHRHDGTIWAESTPNHGATFYFKLRNVARVHNILACKNCVQIPEE